MTMYAQSRLLEHSRWFNPSHRLLWNSSTFRFSRILLLYIHFFIYILHHTVRCHYNAVQYGLIFHTALTGKLWGGCYGDFGENWLCYDDTALYQVEILFIYILNDFGFEHIDGLAQERRNSSALAMELCLSCTNHSMYTSRICEKFIRVAIFSLICQW